MPEMNGSSTPVTSEPFWIGMTIDIIRRNQPAPAICAASSGSLPSWVMAEIPAREAYGIWSAISASTRMVTVP
ncbi:hypothetical protein D3C87_1730290 [compost metagenome]